MASELSALVKKLQACLAKGKPADRLLAEIELGAHADASEADWSAFFAVLVDLWRSPDSETARLALHWLGAGTWMASLHNGPIHAGFPHDFPIDRFLSAASLYAQRGGDHVYEIFDRMQSTFHHLERSPRLVRRLYDALTGWLQRIDASDPRFGCVRPGLIEAAQTAFLPLPSWGVANSLLLARAQYATQDIARSAAGWRMAQYYLAADKVELEPALPAMAEQLAALDVERPGVAGPFLAAFVNDLEIWCAQGGPRPADYIIGILEHRQAPEPDTLPVALGIDYLTHELVTAPEDIRRLVAIGRRDFALLSAYEAGLDLDTLLAEPSET